MKDRMITGLKAGLVTYFIVFLLRSVILIAFSAFNASDGILLWPMALPGIFIDMMIYGVAFGLLFGLIHPFIPSSKTFRKSIAFVFVIYIILGIPIFTASLANVPVELQEAYNEMLVLSQMWWITTMLSAAILLGYFYERFGKK